MWFWRRRHPVSDEELSAYVDDQLSPADRARVEAHLDGCAACRDSLEELRAVKSALGSLPGVPAPRSFALREADVQPQQPAAAGGLARAVPLLSGVTAAAVIAFGVLVGVDLRSSGSGGAADEAFQTSSEDGDAVPDAAAGGDAAESDTRQNDSMFNAVPSEGAEHPAATPGNLPSSQAQDEPALGVAPQATPPGPAPTALPRAERAPTADVAGDGGDDTPWRAAEAATAAVALAGAGSLAFVWWRRRA